MNAERRHLAAGFDLLDLGSVPFIVCITRPLYLVALLLSLVCVAWGFLSSSFNRPEIYPGGLSAILAVVTVAWCLFFGLSCIRIPFMPETMLSAKVLMLFAIAAKMSYVPHSVWSWSPFGKASVSTVILVFAAAWLLAQSRNPRHIAAQIGYTVAVLSPLLLLFSPALSYSVMVIVFVLASYLDNDPLPLLFFAVLASLSMMFARADVFQYVYHPLIWAVSARLAMPELEGVQR